MKNRMYIAKIEFDCWTDNLYWEAADSEAMYKEFNNCMLKIEELKKSAVEWPVFRRQAVEIFSRSGFAPTIK